jgi:hypothetical protein
MRKRGPAAIVGVVLAVSLLGAAPAGAATQVGNACIGNASDTEATYVALANAPGNPLPATFPSAGVVTRWTFSVVGMLEPGILNQSLKILRPIGPGQFQVAGESSGFMQGGLNAIPTRLPVQAGDHIGSSGTVATIPGSVVLVVCNTLNPGDVVATAPGNPGVGSPLATSEPEPGIQIPIVATVEPDADNDGFGDETQDQCPQSAASQGICPTVAVDASSVIKKKGKVIVLVTTTAAAPVTVTGIANLGKGKKAKLSSKAQTVAPGKVTRFTLNFPKKLKNKLNDLQRSKSLQLKLTASATDLIGRVTTDKLKTKLKGQAK